MNTHKSTRAMGAVRTISRRIFMALFCGAALAGCDLKSVYSENTPTNGATWVWEGSASATDADLIGLAQKVISRAPNATMMNSRGVMAIAQIAWPDHVRTSVAPENRWDIYIRTQADGTSKTSLFITASFFKLTGTYLTEASATPEAQARLSSLIGEVLLEGAKWGLASNGAPHVLTKGSH